MAFNNNQKCMVVIIKKKKWKDDAYLCYDLCLIGRGKLFGDMEVMEHINFT